MAILIVEDEWIVSEELKEIFKAIGEDEVYQADNGPDALSILREQLIEVVMLDIRIKGPMSGIELASSLLEVADPKLVFLTSQTDQRTLSQMNAYQDALLLEKPIQEGQLWSILSDLDLPYFPSPDH